MNSRLKLILNVREVGVMLNLSFTTQTIHDDWAAHSGGRKEIQFNIGFEGDDNDWLRYGLAFSLEPGQTLPDPMVLKPKVLKLNEYIRVNQSELEDIRFWYYFESNRSETMPVVPIPEDLILTHTFLFWGKMVSFRQVCIASPDLKKFSKHAGFMSPISW